MGLTSQGPVAFVLVAHLDDTPLNAFIGDRRLNKHYIIYIYLCES